jgi:hypothetical protein
VYSVELSKSSRASSSRAALIAAFKGLGRDIGWHLALYLP